MARKLTRCCCALVLVALSVSQPSAMLAEDETPDLKLEFVRLPMPNDERDVQFRVTNVSTWWADATTVTVQTVAPGPANPMALFVENLDPGQSTIVTYALAAGCDGHEVVAVLAPAKNYAGVLETKLANNRAPDADKPGEGQQLCAAKPQGVDQNKTGLVTRRLPTELVVVPEHMRPGTHTLDFDPSIAVQLAKRRDKRSGVFGAPFGSPYRLEGLRVGWSQREEGNIWDDYVVEIAQSVISFDLSKIKGFAAKPLVSRAVVNFEEAPGKWTNSDGDAETKQGCVARVSLAPPGWESQQPPRMLEGEYFTDEFRPFSREIVVTRQVQQELLFPDDPTVRPGYLLRGEFDDAEGDDDTSCMSVITKVQLHVTYTVLP